MVQIRFKSGDPVFWLSSKGFVKGVVKRVNYEDILPKSGKRRSELRYYLAVDPKGEYQGDLVEEHLIFTSYEDMLKYYSNLKLD